MKPIPLALSVVLLVIPCSAFAQAGSSPLHQLRIENDSGAAPGFFRRHVHLKCGDLDLGDSASGFSGSAAGHSLTAYADKQNHLIEYTIDGEKWGGISEHRG